MRARRRVTNARRPATIACLLAVLVVGCAVPAAHPALDRAHAVVERARSAPRVRALAPAELDLAELALDQADAAARAGAPRAQVEHLAYVASQRAALAEAHAAAQVARSETRLLQRGLDQAAFEASLKNRRTPRLPRDHPQTRVSLQDDQHERVPVEEDQQERVPLKDDQGVRTAEPGPVAADVESMPQDVTLSLAELPFEGAEPTSEVLEELATLVQLMLREPGHSLLIEADFDLPEPEARTMMERRVEVVRAIFLERGVAPARLIVRASGESLAEPRAASSFVEPTE
jgi:OmpA-OmpF porin, OOP family